MGVSAIAIALGHSTLAGHYSAIKSLTAYRRQSMRWYLAMHITH